MNLRRCRVLKFDFHMVLAEPEVTHRAVEGDFAIIACDGLYDVFSSDAADVVGGKGLVENAPGARPLRGEQQRGRRPRVQVQRHRVVVALRAAARRLRADRNITPTYLAPASRLRHGAARRLARRARARRRRSPAPFARNARALRQCQEQCYISTPPRHFRADASRRTVLDERARIGVAQIPEARRDGLVRPRAMTSRGLERPPRSPQHDARRPSACLAALPPCEPHSASSSSRVCGMDARRRADCAEASSRSRVGPDLAAQRRSAAGKARRRRRSPPRGREPTSERASPS